MPRLHEIKNISISNENLSITIDGVEYNFELKAVSTALYKANEKEKETYDISPAGYGIHWPLIDEDLSIDGLLGITHTPDYVKSYA
jgi:hypothetical protein